MDAASELTSGPVVLLFDCAQRHAASVARRIETARPGIATTVVHLPRVSIVDAVGYLRSWSDAVSGGEVRWTEDALAYAAQLESRGSAETSVLVHNAIAVRALARLPLVTSWCVMEAAAHPGFISLVNPGAAAWCRRPRRWPTAAMLGRLRALRMLAAQPR